MGRTHVTAVETDIKVGANVQLGERTLILGKSRSGKSTIVNGVEAAGSGRVSDVAGRQTLARDSELITLANGDSVSAHVTLSDGSECFWGLERGHRAKRTGAEISFPLRAVREALTGEPDKTRRWILLNGRPFDWDDVERFTPDALRSRLRDISLVWDTTEAPDPADRLAQAIDGAKRRVREANAKAKAKPAAPPGPPPTDAEIQAAEEKVAAFSAATRFAGASRRLAEVKQQIPLVRKKIETGQGTIGILRRELDSLPAIRPLTDVMRAALTVVEAFATAKATACVICGNKASPEVFAAKAKQARGAVDETLKAEHARATLEARIAPELNAVTATQRELAGLITEERHLTAITDGGPMPDGDPEEAHRTLAELHDRRARWAAVRAAETECLQAEQDALSWGQLADSLSVTLGKLVERAREDFEQTVQAFLPSAGWQFGIDLYNDGRDVARVGLREDGQLRSALSGVEWATVTAALALATAPEDGPVVIAPEERAFDPDTLAEVCEAFGRFSGQAQVVMTSPIAPSRVPTGWTIVRTDAETVVFAALGAGVGAGAAAIDLAALKPPPMPTATPQVTALPPPPKPKQRTAGRPRRDGTPAMPRDDPNYVPPAREPKILADTRKGRVDPPNTRPGISAALRLVEEQDDQPEAADPEVTDLAGLFPK